MYFKEFSCNQAENMQARCVPRFIQRFRNCGGRTLMKRPPCGFQSPVLSPTPLQRRSRKESAASPALGAGWRKLPRGRGAPLRAASPLLPQNASPLLPQNAARSAARAAPRRFRRTPQKQPAQSERISRTARKEHSRARKRESTIHEKPQSRSRNLRKNVVLFYRGEIK